VDNQIFVLCSTTGDTDYFGNDLMPQICVYNASTFKVEGYIQIPNAVHTHPVRYLTGSRHSPYVANSHALSACSHNKCLYISDKNNCLVRNVPVSSDMFSDLVAQEQELPYANLYGSTRRMPTFSSSRPLSGTRGSLQAGISLPMRAQKQHSEWSVELPPTGLSVNSAHNVLVACGENPVFLEYTTNGCLVRRVTLQPDVQYNTAEHVVQLSRGRYGIIGLQGSMPDYRIVDDNGQVVNKYVYRGAIGVPVADPRSAFVPRRQTVVMSTPCTITVLHPKKVLITDSRNNRIVVLTEVENTFTAECSAGSICGELCQPSCIHYDAFKGRIYVAEYDSGRILCCGK